MSELSVGPTALTLALSKSPYLCNRQRKMVVGICASLKERGHITRKQNHALEELYRTHLFGVRAGLTPVRG